MITRGDGENGGIDNEESQRVKREQQGNVKPTLSGTPSGQIHLLRAPNVIGGGADGKKAEEGNAGLSGFLFDMEDQGDFQDEGREAMQAMYLFVQRPARSMEQAETAMKTSIRRRFVLVGLLSFVVIFTCLQTYFDWENNGSSSESFSHLLAIVRLAATFCVVAFVLVTVFLFANRLRLFTFALILQGALIVFNFFDLSTLQAALLILTQIFAIFVTVNLRNLLLLSWFSTSPLSHDSLFAVDLLY